jgi:hypothetical protein
VQTSAPAPCRHLGPALEGVTGQCKVCAGVLEVPVHRCRARKLCTVERPATLQSRALPWCERCREKGEGYEPVGSQQEQSAAAVPVPTAPANGRWRRHLLFHLYPRRGPDWRWHALWLRERMALFNGRRVVAVVTDRTTDPPGQVRDALAGLGIEWVELPNDPGLREVATHAPLFGRLAAETGPGDVTLYAHSKGVANKSWPDGGATIRRWTEALYETLVDYWPAVQRLLETHPLAGSFKRRGRYWQESVATWHYSGSWFWFRNRDLYARDWRRIDRFWSGIESYPGLHFGVEEAGVVFGHGFPGESSWPYRAEVWRDHFGPELERWRQEQQGRDS